MTRELMFPRRLKREHISFRLVLTRRIPDHPQAAIYRSMPIFSKGRLVEDYLIMGPNGQVLAIETSFERALKALFLAQPALRNRPVRSRRPQPPKLTEREPTGCVGG